MGLQTASEPAGGAFRRLHDPQPLRKTDRAWLERIVAGGVYVADLPAPIAERLIAKRAISLLAPLKVDERPRWLGTARGIEKLAEPA